MTHTIHCNTYKPYDGPETNMLTCVETGHSVIIASDDRFFSIYQHGKVVASLTRPSVHSRNGWEVATKDGKVVVRSRMGAISAFRRFLIYQEGKQLPDHG